MMKLIVKTNKSIRKQTGFSLLEVLIALAVLSIGLLGLAALQSLGLRFSNQSLQQTQATMLAYDIIDRMRANPLQLAASAYAGIDTSSNTYTATTDCAANPCTPAEMRLFDLEQWQGNIGALLTKGQGQIELMADGITHRVTITWSEQLQGDDSQAQGDVERPMLLRMDVRP